MPLRSVDLPGIKAEGPLEETLRYEVAELLKRKSRGFPGANPVSFSRKHLKELENKDYYVCEKSDGMRYLLYFTEDEAGQEIHYFINRKNEFWFIPYGKFHCPKLQDPQGWHTRTIIDGELVIDKLPSGETQPVYLVFDCMVLDGQSLMNRTLDKRLAYFKDRIFDPYAKLFKMYQEEVQYQHFVMKLKAMQFSYAIDAMFKQVLPTLPHGNDGLIFTCRTSDYKFGTDHNILKWKPESENSIDFKMRLQFPTVQPDEVDIAEGFTEPYFDYDALPIFNIYIFTSDKTEDKWYGTMYVEPEEWDKLKALEEPLDDRIVECFMDSQKRWRYMRFRDDKSNANHTSTVESVIESIMDPVTEQELISAAPRIREKWKQRDEETFNRQKRNVGQVAKSTSDVEIKSPTDNKRKSEELESIRSSPRASPEPSPKTMSNLSRLTGGTKRKAENQGPQRPIPNSTER
ncbi:mRNA-capping enzyme subunit alpha [Erysiphe neolycopersici]|uniref:mRNA-capping enzyme subunit alpha n=1 Tax=Erysiphe neolycopersici TaxID=212602 RepID=A0A420I014_9PEZI|nr:mRNA-capping enzyme subunit alpha [Erysiphe neolycopersici]